MAIRRQQVNIGAARGHSRGAKAAEGRPRDATGRREATRRGYSSAHRRTLAALPADSVSPGLQGSAEGENGAAQDQVAGVDKAAAARAGHYTARLPGARHPGLSGRIKQPGEEVQLPKLASKQAEVECTGRRQQVNEQGLAVPSFGAETG